MRYRSILVLLTLLVATGSCATSGGDSESSASRSSEAATGENADSVDRYTDLDSTLWVQSGAEREAHVRQAYRLATLRLDQALQSDEWTASLEQEEMGGYEEKPPAVIVDVDETVLDNAAYQARLLERGETFSIETWNDWCREVSAPAVPGALQFAKYAASQDVTVFYVTNRQHAVEDATRENLEKHGFPLSEDRDVILTKGEKDSWGSDKTPRRKTIAEDFRIVLLIGDNLGDFVGETEVSSEARSKKVRKWRERWGKHWITVANPMYGDWESSAYDYDHGLDRSEKIEQKLDALEPRREGDDG